MRHLPACLAASAFAVAAAYLPAPALAADDIGSNPITELFDGLGLGAKEKPDIDYQERAPLVPPSQTGSLPAPQAKGASRAGVAWPNDPDVAARAERKARENKVMTESYSYKMDRSPRVDPDELSARRTIGAGVPRNGGDGATRADNQITRSERGDLDGKMIRGVEGTGSARPRLTDPPTGYMQGNGVTAQAQPEKAPWYKRMFGAN